MKVYVKELQLNENFEEIKDSIKEINIVYKDKLVDLLLRLYPSGFEEETEVYINKEKIDIDNYDIELKNNDIVTINKLPHGFGFIAMLVINIVISLVMSYLFKPKKVDKSANESQSIYTTKNNQISAKLGSPFPIQYGNFRQYPIKISKDYSFYYNNEEYQILHTTLGIGEYTINDIYMNETNINNLIGNNVQYMKLGATSKNIISSMKSTFTNINADFMGYIVQQCTDIQSVQFNENAVVGEHTLNDNNYINKAIINFNFGNGVYSQDTEGNTVSTSVNIKITYIEIDENDIETGFKKTDYLSFSASSRTAVRKTVLTKLKNGIYKIKIERLDTGFDSQTSKDCNIESVYSFNFENDYSKIDDITTLTFLVKVSSSISSSSSFTLNVDCDRTDVGNTLRDFIYDIWTNSKYGINESISFLDIRDQLDQEISLFLDTEENCFDQIQSVLKSFGYKFYPHLSKFVIKKEAAQLYNKYIFNSKNCSKINFTYRLNEDDKNEKGVKIRYIKKGQANFEEYYFPADKNQYDETVLIGINDEAYAKKMASFIYDKQKKITKTCSVETGLNGIIPEIDDRVGVAIEYVDSNFACFVKEINEDLNYIKLDQRFLFKANTQYYLQLVDIDNNFYSIINAEVFEVDTFVDDFYYSTSNTIYVENKQNLVCVIGDLVEIVESYLISNIESKEINQDVNKPVTVSIDLQKYVGEIYQNIEI